MENSMKRRVGLIDIFSMVLLLTSFVLTVIIMPKGSFEVFSFVKDLLNFSIVIILVLSFLQRNQRKIELLLLGFSIAFLIIFIWANSIYFAVLFASSFLIAIALALLILYFCNVFKTKSTRTLVKLIIIVLFVLFSGVELVVKDKFSNVSLINMIIEALRAIGLTLLFLNFDSKNKLDFEKPKLHFYILTIYNFIILFTNYVLLDFGMFLPSYSPIVLGFIYVAMFIYTIIYFYNKRKPAYIIAIISIIIVLLLSGINRNLNIYFIIRYFVPTAFKVSMFVVLLLLDSEFEKVKPDQSHVQSNIINKDDYYVNIGKSILFVFITFGIYGIIWRYRVIKALKRFNKSLDVTKEFLLCIFVPFYMVYFMYAREKELANYKKHKLHYSSDNSIIYLILSLLGFNIVAIVLMQDDLNNLFASYDSEAIDEIKFGVNLDAGLSIKERLAQLEDIYKSGLISSEEYETKKQAILKEL